MIRRCSGQRNRRRLAVLLGVLAVSTSGLAADPPEQAPVAEGASGWARMARIGREVRKLGDWDAQYELFAPHLDDLWDAQGWFEESDTFALETLHEVARIPPWEISRRIDTLTGAIRDRYELSDEQYSELKMQSYGMVGAMAIKHGGTLFRHVREMVNTRTEGEPFDPRQIARWTRESENIIEDARRQFEQIAENMANGFSPQQRALYERDVASYQQRRAAFNDMRQRWAQGQWQPADWGLQDDPVHRPLVERQAQRAARSAAAAELAARYAPTDETSWARFVRLFIRRYELEEAQVQAAQSILRELEVRAAHYRQAHRAELAAVAVQERLTADAYGPVRAMFDELQRRLQPIPTAAQRRRAEMREADESESGAQPESGTPAGRDASSSAFPPE